MNIRTEAHVLSGFLWGKTVNSVGELSQEAEAVEADVKPWKVY